MKYKKFILDSFKKLEDGDKSGFVSNLSDDIEWVENKDTVHGKKSVSEELSKLYSNITSSCLTFLNVWEVDDTYVITADLTVNTTDKCFDDIPWTAIVKVRDGVMNRVEVFTDAKKIIEEK